MVLGDAVLLRRRPTGGTAQRHLDGLGLIRMNAKALGVDAPQHDQCRGFARARSGVCRFAHRVEQRERLAGVCRAQLAIAIVDAEVQRCVPACLSHRRPKCCLRERGPGRIERFGVEGLLSKVAKPIFGRPRRKQ